MKTQRARILIAAFTALLIGGLTLVAVVAPRLKRIQRRAPPAPLVAQTTVPQNIENVAAGIRRVFNDEGDLNRGTHKLAREDLFSHFYLFPNTHPIFPDDFQIQHWAATDPYLRAYAAIPKSKRNHDFFLYEPTADYYWFSDYFYNDAPAKFRCAFIVHLESEGDGSTRLEVFEYLPTIWVGRRLGFSAHAIGLTWLYDIRPVEATNSDRIRLLERIRENTR